MKLSPVMMWTVMSALAISGPVWSWRAYAASSIRAQAARAALETLRQRCDELSRLRAAAPRWSTEAHQEGALAPRVASILTASGISASALVTLSPQAQPLTGMAGAGLAKRGAALTLAPVTLPELGSFLQNWRTSEPGWIVSSIDVGPGEATSVPPGADLPLRVNLTIESLLAEDSGGSP